MKFRYEVWCAGVPYGRFKTLKELEDELRSCARTGNNAYGVDRKTGKEYYADDYAEVQHG